MVLTNSCAFARALAVLSCDANVGQLFGTVVFNIPLNDYHKVPFQKEILAKVNARMNSTLHDADQGAHVVCGEITMTENSFRVTVYVQHMEEDYGSATRNFKPSALFVATRVSDFKFKIALDSVVSITASTFELAYSTVTSTITTTATTTLSTEFVVRLVGCTSIDDQPFGTVFFNSFSFTTFTDIELQIDIRDSVISEANSILSGTTTGVNVSRGQGARQGRRSRRRGCA